jgi:hypothetical protein
MTVQNKRLIGIVVTVALILLIPLIAMQFTDEVNWDVFDFVLFGTALFVIGLAYELVARRLDLPASEGQSTPETTKTGKTLYRVALGIGLGGAFLLFWVNGAVGIIGNEGQPANLMYGAVFLVGFIGSLIARFKPQGMARTLFAMAFVQLLIPVIAGIIWPQVSWGGAGMVGVFMLNAFFAMLFVVSGFLFREVLTQGRIAKNGSPEKRQERKGHFQK